MHNSSDLARLIADLQRLAADGTAPGDPSMQRLMDDLVRLGRQRGAYEQSEIGTWSWSDALHLDHAARALLGVSDEAPLSEEQAIRLVHREDRAPLRAAATTARAEAGSFAVACRVGFGHSERSLWVQGSALPTGGLHGTVLPHPCTADLQLARAQAQAGVRAKSSFLVQVSHDLRTPLNGIIGLSELLQQEHFGALNPRQRSYVENILHSGRHLLELVDDILDLSSIEAGTLVLVRSWCSVAQIVRPCLDALRPLLEEREVEVVEVLPEDLPAVYVDAARLRQVLLHVLLQAVTQVPRAGRVDIEASVSGGELTIEVRRPGEVAAPPGEDPSRGEAVIQRLVDLHGGALVRRPGAEGGQVVKLSVLTFRPGSPAAKVPFQEPTVVLVNPHRAEAHLQADALRSAGLGVRFADDPVQAVTASRGMPAVAWVMDARDPDPSTWDALAALTRTRGLGGAPLVLITHEDPPIEALQSEAAAHLIHPVAPEELVAGLACAGVRTWRLDGVRIWYPSASDCAEPLVEVLAAAGSAVERGPDAPGEPPDIVIVDTEDPPVLDAGWDGVLTLGVGEGPSATGTPGPGRHLQVGARDLLRAPQRVVRWVHHALARRLHAERLLTPMELRAAVEHQLAAAHRTGAPALLVSLRVRSSEAPPPLLRVLAHRLRKDDAVGWVAPGVLAVVPGRVTYGGAAILRDRFCAAVTEGGLEWIGARITLYPDDGADADTLLGVAGLV